MNRDCVQVEFRDKALKGCIFFLSWGEAMGFIFALNRRERFDPQGRYARVVW
jgi:hypothetical protein